MEEILEVRKELKRLLEVKEGVDAQLEEGRKLLKQKDEELAGLEWKINTLVPLFKRLHGILSSSMKTRSSAAHVGDEHQSRNQGLNEEAALRYSPDPSVLFKEPPSNTLHDRKPAPDDEDTGGTATPSDFGQPTRSRAGASHLEFEEVAAAASRILREEMGQAREMRQHPGEESEAAASRSNDTESEEEGDHYGHTERDTGTRSLRGSYSARFSRLQNSRGGSRFRSRSRSRSPSKVAAKNESDNGDSRGISGSASASTPLTESHAALSRVFQEALKGLSPQSAEVVRRRLPPSFRGEAAPPATPDTEGAALRMEDLESEPEYKAEDQEDQTFAEEPSTSSKQMSWFDRAKTRYLQEISRPVTLVSDTAHEEQPGAKTNSYDESSPMNDDTSPMAEESNHEELGHEEGELQGHWRASVSREHHENGVEGADADSAEVQNTYTDDTSESDHADINVERVKQLSGELAQVLRRVDSERRRVTGRVVVKRPAFEDNSGEGVDDDDGGGEELAMLRLRSAVSGGDSETARAALRDFVARYDTRSARRRSPPKVNPVAQRLVPPPVLSPEAHHSDSDEDLEPVEAVNKIESHLSKLVHSFPSSLSELR